jgi:hypothetical protein
MYSSYLFLPFCQTDVQKRFNGELLPADPLVCTTQNVTFTCVLKDDPVSNFSIGFTFKTRETNGKFVTVDQNRVTYINETMAEYTVTSIPPLSDVNKPNFMYVKSFYWQEIGDVNETLQLGTTTSVRVYRKFVFSKFEFIKFELNRKFVFSKFEFNKFEFTVSYDTFLYMLSTTLSTIGAIRVGNNKLSLI